MIDTADIITDYQGKIENYDVPQLNAEIQQTLELAIAFTEARQEMGVISTPVEDKPQFDELFDQGLELLIKGTILLDTSNKMDVEASEQFAELRKKLHYYMFNRMSEGIIFGLHFLTSVNGREIASPEQIAQLYTVLSKSAVILNRYRDERNEGWVEAIFQIVEDNKLSPKMKETRDLMEANRRLDNLVSCVEHYRYDLLPIKTYFDLIYALKPGIYENGDHIRVLCASMANNDPHVFNRVVEGFARNISRGLPFNKVDLIDAFESHILPSFVDIQSSQFTASIWAHLIANTKAGKRQLFKKIYEVISTAPPEQAFERCVDVTTVLGQMLQGHVYGYDKGVVSPLTQPALEEIRIFYKGIIDHIKHLMNQNQVTIEMIDQCPVHKHLLPNDNKELVDAGIFTTEELTSLIN